MKQVMLDLGSSPYKKPFQQWIPTNTAATFSAVGTTPMQQQPQVYQPLLSSPLNTNLNQQTINKVKNQQKLNSLNANQKRIQERRQKLNDTFQTIGQVSDALGSVLPQNSAYDGTYGGVTQGIDTAYDQASNAVMMFNPLIGGIMKTAGFVNKGLNALGVGTDGQTVTDAILGSSLLGLTPIGLANSLGAKSTDKFHQNDNALAQVGGNYAGSTDLFKTAKVKSNKKYGLFSSGARHRANQLIANAQGQMNTITDIADQAQRDLALDGMANYQLYQLRQNGGPQAMYVAAKGAKLRVKKVCNKVHKKLKGGIITPQPFIPVITLTNTIKLQQGGNVKPSYDQWIKTVPTNRLDKNYDLKTAYDVLPFNELEAWRTATDEELSKGTKHLSSVNPKADANGNLFFLKLGKLEDNPELQGEFDWYNSDDAKQFREEYAPAQFDESTNRYFYPKKYEHGGAVAIKITIVKDLNEPKEKEKENTEPNVIPEGALHAHKHNIENTDGLTQKGIPVVDDKGAQCAEIEKDEIILNLKLTNQLEELQKQYEKASKTEQDKLAIEAGKLLVQEILYNTIDNTGLIDKCEKGGKINGSK